MPCVDIEISGVESGYEDGKLCVNCREGFWFELNLRQFNVSHGKIDDKLKKDNFNCISVN